MKAGIIAAGDGRRLQAAYPETPKPLVPVGGRPLVHWIVSSLRAAGTRAVTVLLNSRGRAVRDYLSSQFAEMEWTFLERDTRSSWESFRLVGGQLARDNERFLMSTVDALVPPSELSDFIRASSRLLQEPAPGCVATLALTRFVEDENPLWAELGPDGRVAVLGPEARTREFVTCGLYALSRGLARSFPPAEAHRSLRGFWAEAAGGGRVAGIPLGATVDVDRPQDLRTADAFTGRLEG